MKVRRVICKMVDDMQAKEFGVDEALRLTGQTDQQSIETVRFVNVLLTV